MLAKDCRFDTLRRPNKSVVSRERGTWAPKDPDMPSNKGGS